MSETPLRTARRIQPNLAFIGLTSGEPVNGVGWWVPSEGGMSVAGGQLSAVPPGHHYRRRHDGGEDDVPDVDPLTDFLLPFSALCDANDFPSAVLGYARTWGMLGLCEHGLPYTHLPIRLETGRSQQLSSCRRATSLSRELRQTVFVEPLSRWMEFSRQAQAILGFSVPDHDLAQEAEWWAALKPLYPPFMVTPDPEVEGNDGRPGPAGRPRAETIIDEAGQEIAVGGSGWFETEDDAVGFAVRRWLDLGDVRPHFEWGYTGRAQWGFAANTLFAGLALAIAVHLSTKRSLRSCSLCGRLFEPSAQRQNVDYCKSEACLRRVSADNSRRYRAHRKVLRKP